MDEKRTILFVDDEEKVLKSLQRGLLDESYHCLFASGGKQALDLLEQQTVHVICADLRMPGMTGLELLMIVKARYPHTVRLALSGYAQAATFLPGPNQSEVLRVVAKPWEWEPLKSVLREAIEQYDLQASCPSHRAMSTQEEKPGT